MRQKQPLSEWIASTRKRDAVAYRVSIGDGPRDHDPVVLVVFGDGKPPRGEGKLRPLSMLANTPPDDIATAIEDAAGNAGWPDESRTLRVLALSDDAQQISSWVRSVDPEPERDEHDDDDDRKSKKNGAAANRYDFGAAALDVVKNSNNALIEMVKAASGHSAAQSAVITTLSVELGKSLQAQREGVDEVGEARAAAFDSMLSNTLAGFAAEVEENGDDPAWGRAWATFEGFVGRLLGMAPDAPNGNGGGFPKTPDEWKDFAKKNSAAFRQALTDPETVAAIRAGMEGDAKPTQEKPA